MSRSDFQKRPIFGTRQLGFSLVELLVALLIGMIGSIVMMEVFSLSEANKRAANSGNDSNIEGLTGFYAIQRDIRMAGYSIVDSKILGCSLVLRAGVTLPSGLAPVTINHSSITGQDANTDTVLAVYGNTNMSTQGDRVLTSANDLLTASMFSVGNRVVQASSTRGGACSLTLETVSGVAGSTVSLNSGTPLVLNNTLFNLGQTLTAVVYAVRSGNLTRCDYITNDCGNAANNSSSSVWVPVGNNIVSLRSQYGRDTAVGSLDHRVDQYDQTTPTGTGAVSVCSWARIPSIRMAVVARNSQYEKNVVTANAPVWDGSATNPVVLTANSEWQNYRYRLFQAVVPVRNVAWIGEVSGC